MYKLFFNFLVDNTVSNTQIKTEFQKSLFFRKQRNKKKQFYTCFLSPPFSALNILRSNIWGCRVTQTIVVQIAFHMSRLGFVGLAVDRFVAIVYPLKYRKWGKTSTGWITVAVFLAITVIVNGPYFMYTEVYKSGTLLGTKVQLVKLTTSHASNA